MTTTSLASLTAAVGDRYRIERELGAGGMATVYLAEDVRHRRRVALKLLHPELSAVLGGERFLKEIELTANLQHPHILPLFDSGEASGQLFYVMPYVEGETLRARLERERQLPLGDALRIAIEVADALQYAHERGVIHRDIKPENVLLQGGHALVADFGIALAVQQAGGQRMTQTGLSLGTPQYMAPEQALGEKTIDARADIYALGAVLYEMLAGEAPFTGPTAQAIVARVLTANPTPLSETRATVPPNVDRAVLTALAKLPADRFSTARAFVAALESTAIAAPIVRSTATFTNSAGWWKRVAILSSVAAVAAIGWGLTRTASVGRTGSSVTRVVIGMADDQVPRIPNGGDALTLSPDGKHLVYVGPGNGTRGTQLWVRSLNELSAKPIPGTASAQSPKLSRDGRSVFFIRNASGVVVSLETGQAVTIPGVITDAAWGDEGKLYVFSIDGSLRRMVIGGSVDTLIRADSGTFRLGMSLLPGERAALFVRWRPFGPVAANAREVVRNSGELVSVSFDDGKITPIVAAVFGQYLPSGHLLYVTGDGTAVVAPFDVRQRHTTGPGAPVAKVSTVAGYLGAGAVTPQLAASDEGSLIYIPAGAGPAQRLAWLTAAGQEQPAVPVEGTFEGLALSPDDRRVAVALRQGGAESDTLLGIDIWVVDLTTGAKTRLTTTGRYIRPSWSPDGTRVRFVAQGTGLAERSADATTPIRVIVSDSVSPSGRIAEGFSVPGDRFVLRNYPRSSRRGRDIVLYDPGARDSTTRGLATSAADESNPRLSPDGHWLAYSSNETGRQEIYVVPFPLGGARVAVTTDGGSWPRWSPDGRTLYYFTLEGALMMAAVRTAPTFVVERRQPHPSSFMNAPSTDQYYDAARDGRILVTRDGSPAPRFVLVRNWFTELAR